MRQGFALFIFRHFDILRPILSPFLFAATPLPFLILSFFIYRLFYYFLSLFYFYACAC